MADVFISYAREDKAWALLMATALDALGLSVWYDTEGLSPGADFAAEIEAQLEAAKAVVVLWSRNSATSEWVRDEADHAKEQDKLISVIVDELSAPPLGFRRRHAAHLKTWRGGLDDAAFAPVRRALEDKTGRTLGVRGQSTRPASRVSAPTPPRRGPEKGRPAQPASAAPARSELTFWQTLIAPRRRFRSFRAIALYALAAVPYGLGVGYVSYVCWLGVDDNPANYLMWGIFSTLSAAFAAVSFFRPWRAFAVFFGA